MNYCQHAVTVEGVAMKVSARNQMRGTVSAIKEGAVEAQVTLDVGGQKITSVITMDALADLGLSVGAPAIAIVKADHVMLGVD
jgi:molybdate transport system regulatory protein